MKILLNICLLLVSICGVAQQSQEELEVKATVDAFFEAFHAQDSIALKKLAHPSIVMQSISVKEDGAHKIFTETYSNFIKAIVAIPSTTKFEEKLHSYEIRVNGPMANVATPYSVYVNEQLQHCGVNTFQLFKEDDKWQIVYIIDTRTKKDCDTMSR